MHEKGGLRLQEEGAAEGAVGGGAEDEETVASELHASDPSS